MVPDKEWFQNMGDTVAPPEILLVGAKGTPTDYWISIAAEGSGDWDDEMGADKSHTPPTYTHYLCKILQR